jgi:hypothetical protein
MVIVIRPEWFVTLAHCGGGITAYRIAGNTRPWLHRRADDGCLRRRSRYCKLEPSHPQMMLRTAPIRAIEVPWGGCAEAHDAVDLRTIDRATVPVAGTTVYFGATGAAQINAAGPQGIAKSHRYATITPYEDKRDGDQSDEPHCGRSTKIPISLNMPSFMHQASANLC